MAMSSRELRKKEEEVRNQYPGEGLVTNVHEGTVLSESQYRIRLHEMRNSLFFGLIIGVLLGFGVSLIYGVIEEFFSLQLHHKLILGVVSIIFSIWLFIEVWNDRAKYVGS
ncbi:MAG: hypothetical protein KAS11_00290 [Candidatus Aenigmarchaeota archaeon]|nr:hypothetical protein [Candidatus Aenigmarchaeota archaeon]